MRESFFASNKRSVDSRQAGLVTRTLNTICWKLNASAFAVRGPLAIGRLLLSLATISLLSAPLTQHFWNWDHFLHGGQDFETGILGIVIIFCLAVLLSRLCQQQLDSLFLVRRTLALYRDHRQTAATSLLRNFVIFPIEAGASTVINTHPLKI
jgi:hypothetical protein